MAQVATEHIPAVVHLYRGELARMTAYRVRLDTTTRWAVATTAAIASFSLATPSMHHEVFGLAIWFNLIFLWLEARRYRTYVMLLHRVRLMETGFFGPILGGPEDDEWQERVVASLHHPEWTMTRLQSLSVRLRRTYLWLILGVYLGWLVKVDVHHGIPAGAQIGALPGTTVMVLAFVLLVPLVLLALYHPMVEEG